MRFFTQNKTLRFDLDALRRDLEVVDAIAQRESPLGEHDVQALMLTQVPNQPESRAGGNVHGIYWTRPDHTGVEVPRGDGIDEAAYTEFVSDFQGTYFEHVVAELRKHYAIGRVRLLWKHPRTTLSLHRDPEPRLHLVIHTNPGACMVIEDECFHIPADGHVWVTNTERYHTAFNGGEEVRVHLVATVLDLDKSVFLTEEQEMDRLKRALEALGDPIPETC